MGERIHQNKALISNSKCYDQHNANGTASNHKEYFKSKIKQKTKKLKIKLKNKNQNFFTFTTTRKKRNYE